MLKKYQLFKEDQSVS